MDARWYAGHMTAQSSIPIGSRVVLRTCPDAGQPGVVTGSTRGKMAVMWADIAPDYLRLHDAASLLVID